MGFVEKVTKYGTWSGKGWSNGVNYPGRKVLESEMEEAGIDPYDNYVAKAHDLNEILAADKLRGDLQKIPKAPHNELLQTINPKQYKHDLQYTPVSRLGAIFGVDRCVDIEKYMDASHSVEISDAFYQYYDWKMRSNQKYYFDVKRNKASKYWISLTRIFLGFAPHNFASEAAELERLMLKLIDNNAVSTDIKKRSRENLEANFVSRGFDNPNSRKFMKPLANHPFDPIVQVETIFDGTHHDLMRLANSL